MQIKQPKNNEKYYWTQHVFAKMQQYGISENTVKRIIRNPERLEEGIAPDTKAAMQTRGKKNKYELWTMWQENNKTQKSQKTKNQEKPITIITAWRYPGISPRHSEIPVPEDILEELNKIV